jgi:DNA-binding PadR family transcriptional regulator
MNDESLPPYQPLAPAVFHILIALAGKELHGYGVMQEILRITQGRYQIGLATLYRSIKHMAELGLIQEADERPDPALDDERRRYYSLTSLGRRLAQAEALRYAQLVEAAHIRNLLGNEPQGGLA